MIGRWYSRKALSTLAYPNGIPEIVAPKACTRALNLQSGGLEFKSPPPECYLDLFAAELKSSTTLVNKPIGLPADFLNLLVLLISFICVIHLLGHTCLCGI